MSKGRRRWMSEPKERANSLYCYLFVPFIPLMGGCPIGEDGSSSFSLWIQMPDLLETSSQTYLEIMFQLLPGHLLGQSS